MALDSTSASLNTATEGMIKYFGYSSGIERITNADESLFFQTIINEIDEERPVLFSFPGHAVVADGYSSDGTGRNIHINFGWGGHADGFYYINGNIQAGNYIFPTSPPNLDIYYNIQPCTKDVDCYEDYVSLETEDSMQNLSISGKFNFEEDIDRYETYLKGSTQITGDRGYSNQAFYIMIYNTKNEILYSSSDPLDIDLEADKYYINISLKNESNASFTYNEKTDYTVEIVTESLTQDDYDNIANQDISPVIYGDFPMINIDGPYKIYIEASDEDGDDLVLNAKSSNNSISTQLDKNILTLTPLVDNAYASITIEAVANNKKDEKFFNVLITDVPFGTEFTITGEFESQDDYNEHKLILDGTCTIKGYNGYSNQAFYTSLLDNNSQVLMEGVDDLEYIYYNADMGIYYVGASLKENPGGYGGYYTFDEDNTGYSLNVSCPDANISLESLVELLGIESVKIQGDFDSNNIVDLKDLIILIRYLSK